MQQLFSLLSLSFILAFSAWAQEQEYQPITHKDIRTQIEICQDSINQEKDPNKLESLHQLLRTLQWLDKQHPSLLNIHKPKSTNHLRVSSDSNRSNSPRSSGELERRPLLVAPNHSTNRSYDVIELPSVKQQPGKRKRSLLARLCLCLCCSKPEN